jgi:hypothetical protein
MKDMHSPLAGRRPKWPESLSSKLGSSNENHATQFSPTDQQNSEIEQDSMVGRRGGDMQGEAWWVRGVPAL